MFEEKFRTFLKKYLDDNIESTVKAVVSATKSRQTFTVHVSLQVYITKEKDPPEEVGNFTGQVIVRDLRVKTQKLDHRHN